MMHAATTREPQPMRDASTDTLCVWALGGLGSYLVAFGQAVQVALGVLALVVSILCGLATLQRFLWDREDRREARARRLGPPAPPT